MSILNKYTSGPLIFSVLIHLRLLRYSTDGVIVTCNEYTSGPLIFSVLIQSWCGTTTKLQMLHAGQNKLQTLSSFSTSIITRATMSLRMMVFDNEISTNIHSVQYGMSKPEADSHEAALGRRRSQSVSFFFFFWTSHSQSVAITDHFPLPIQQQRPTRQLPLLLTREY